MFFLYIIFLIPVINGQYGGQSCGTMRSYYSTESRIVGGETASDYAWPWQVYISVYGQFTCGGTLIDRQHVVTGAHCIVGQSNDARDYLVRVGAHNMIRQGYYAGIFHSVSAIFVHDKYVSAEYGYDIAIIRLARPVDLSDAVNVICLPPSSGYYVPMYSAVVVTGFGLTREGGSLPNTLQQALIQLLPTCNRAYSLYNSATQICAGIQNGGVDTCQGTFDKLSWLNKNFCYYDIFFLSLFE